MPEARNSTREVTMAPKERHDKSPKRKSDDSDQPARPLRDVREDPSPNPDDDSQREKPLPETIDEP